MITITLPQKFLTPTEYQTADWTMYDDIRFFTEHPNLCNQTNTNKEAAE